MSSQHAKKIYDRHCLAGHQFSTGDAAARWTTRKGNARYWCPTCLQQGKHPPKDWKKV